jgi:hypothetical protein
MTSSTAMVTKPRASDRRIDAANQKLRSLLVDTERLEDHAAQLRFVAYIGLRRRVIVAATSQRLLVFKRRLLGGYQLIDLQWRDLADASIAENILPFLLGSNLKVRESSQGVVEVRGLESASAARLYARLQQHEQAWREKNRLRAMEEMRAKAGSVTVGGHNIDAAVGEAVPLPSRTVQSSDDAMRKIKQLKEMLDQGAISDTEFETLKAKIINAM